LEPTADAILQGFNNFVDGETTVSLLFYNTEY